MASDLLFELGTEEIPSRMLAKALVRDGKIRQVSLEHEFTSQFDTEFNSQRSTLNKVLSNAGGVFIWIPVFLVAIFFFVGVAPNIEVALPALARGGEAVDIEQLLQSGRDRVPLRELLELSARELSLLEVLLQRAGRLVSKDQLVERLCEWGEEVSNNAIEVYIHRLRKKIEQGPIRIATVRGLGYCLEKIPN